MFVVNRLNQLEMIFQNFFLRLQGPIYSFCTTGGSRETTRRDWTSRGLPAAAAFSRWAGARLANAEREKNGQLHHFGNGIRDLSSIACDLHAEHTFSSHAWGSSALSQRLSVLHILGSETAFLFPTHACMDGCKILGVGGGTRPLLVQLTQLSRCGVRNGKQRSFFNF